MLAWVGAVGVVGVENSECVGDVCGADGVDFRQVVVGDDKVEAERLGGAGGGEGTDAGVDADNEADAFGGGGFEDLVAHAVAFFEAVRDVEADFASQHFNRRFEEDGGGGAVYVVVAVYKDGLVVLDRLLHAGDGGLHAAHQVGVVEVVELRVEESVYVFGGADAAGDEEFGDDEREVGGAR